MTKKLPTVSIQGKEYTLVKDRIVYFNETFPNGSIQTELIENTESVVVKAKVTPDHEHPERFFTAYSQAVKGDGHINKTSALENCETSSVGRALAFLSIGIIESVASADEIHKTTYPVRKTAQPYERRQADNNTAELDAVSYLNDNE